MKANDYHRVGYVLGKIKEDKTNTKKMDLKEPGTQTAPLNGCYYKGKGLVYWSHKKG